MQPDTSTVPDSEYRGWLRWLPSFTRPYALLARFDRPIGWWLLFWPGFWGVALAGGLVSHWPLLVWLLIGAIAMRGAGCVYNDMVDVDIDRRVARTRSRPIASGQVSRQAAAVFALALCGVGLIVLLQLSRLAQIIALASVLPVLAYPFMKRITWWPQAWLGIVFSWAALVGWVAVADGTRWIAGVLLYAGSIFWVVGYDSIYALQDLEDDAIAGVKSSARAMGRHIRKGVMICYAIALLLWGAAFWHVRPDPLVLAALLPAAAHFYWQVVTLDAADGANALYRFRSNRFAGLLVALACTTVGMSS